MRSLFTTIVILFLFQSVSYSQLKKIDDVQKQLDVKNKDTVAWAYGYVFDLGFNEGFLHNWAAGGEIASLTTNALFSGHLDRLNGRAIWSNNLDMTYGLNYAYSQDFVPHKTDDRIDFTSKYGYRLDTVKDFYLTGLFNFKSQLTKGYNYSYNNWDSFSTSKFLSPAYYTLALGAEYRKGSDVSLFLSPAAGRLTTATTYYTRQSPQGAFGIAYDKTSYWEFGAYFSGRFTLNINKNMIFKTRVDLYSNYLAKDTKDTMGHVIKKDNPGNVSVLFDNLYSYKISKHMSLTVGLTFIYDNNIPYVKPTTDVNGVAPDKLPGNGLGWLQTKQVFTLGIEYKRQ
jgi:Protein of unknown function (DUF3078)